MKFYKEIKQKRKKLNDGTFSLSNIQPIDNLDDWNNFVAKFKELVNQKVESDPQKDSFLITDNKLKGYWPKDKDGKIMDPEIVSQLLDMVLEIRIRRSIDNDEFYIDVSNCNNYQDKKHALFSWLLVICMSIAFCISISNSPLTFVISIIWGAFFSILVFNLFKEDILKFRYLRKLKKKVLLEAKNEKKQSDGINTFEKIAKTLMGISMMMILFTCAALLIDFWTMPLVGIRSFTFWVKFDCPIELLFLCSAIYLIYLIWNPKNNLDIKNKK